MRTCEKDKEMATPATENSLAEALKGRTLVLASTSPRRIEFFEKLGVPFLARTGDVREHYPDTLTDGREIAQYLSRLKARAAGPSYGPTAVRWANPATNRKPRRPFGRFPDARTKYSPALPCAALRTKSRSAAPPASRSCPSTRRTSGTTCPASRPWTRRGPTPSRNGSGRRTSPPSRGRTTTWWGCLRPNCTNG